MFRNPEHTQNIWPDGGPGNGIDIVSIVLPVPDGGVMQRLGPPVNGNARAFYPVISSDDLTLYYTLDVGLSADHEIAVARRATKNDPFGGAALVTELNTPDAREGPMWLSPDGCTLYVHRVTTERQLLFATRGK